ncbi:MAG: hypothetical protein JW395_2445 [Nitrospira sp.]|nr:hypothetical protein [Nitrospira sp.]
MIVEGGRRLKANRDALAAQWEEGVRFLELFRQREGHCRVPQKHREQGYRLGAWVHNQRKEKDTMLPERRARLDMLGFVWDPFTAQWEEGFRSLEIFRQREGHCRVPQKHREQGYRLGAWVHNQRVDKETMLPDRRQRLDALGFVWDPFAVQWEEGFRFLEHYRQENGDCRVPRDYCDPTSGYRLGSWVNHQRRDQDTMLPERHQRLDALGFAWDPFGASWEEGFLSLERYHKENGDCLVPLTYRDPMSGFLLGQWVSVQRRPQMTMPPERRERLDALGFVWDPLAAQWEIGLHFLQIFCQREGHYRVPGTYRDPASGYRLGSWVNHQRRDRDTMPPERRARLDALGFVWKVR